MSKQRQIPRRKFLRDLGSIIALSILGAKYGLPCLIASETTVGSTPLHDYPVKPVPFAAVHLNDAIWAPRLETNRVVTIPYAFEKCKETGRMNNFERAAAVLHGENIPDGKPPGYPFDDTDLYKVLEGASYSIAAKAKWPSGSPLRKRMFTFREKGALLFDQDSFTSAPFDSMRETGFGVTNAAF